MGKIIIFICGILFLQTACKTTGSEKLVYSIKNYELNEDQLSFTLKSTSSKTISEFCLYVEYCNTDYSNEEADFFVTEKKFSCSLENGETEDFSFKLFEDENLFTMDEDELTNAISEDSIFIQRIYLKEITFEDSSHFIDKYGSWSF